MSALADLRVVDLSTGIAGAYVAKMFVDAGADVVKVEPAGGDGMRRLQPALFAYLHAGVRSVSTRGDLVSRADLVIETDTPIADRPDTQVVVSITPYGRTGPWSGRPATEFTIQAECGSIGGRGLPGGEPFQAGGRIAEWAAGTFAAAAALGALQQAQRTGRGEHVDVSMLEVMTTAMGFGDLTHQLTGLDAPVGPAQTVEIPSIEPTIDGFVGFCTNSRQQFDDFLVLIERPDLLDDEGLRMVGARWRRFDEWNAIVRAFTTKYTTDEILRTAEALRIPAAPVCDAPLAMAQTHLIERGVFVTNPTGGFTQPRRPYKVDHADPPLPRPTRDPGADEGFRWSVREPTERGDATGRGLDGVRVLDLTAWWAGPSSTQILAAFGADVIHVESVGRLDGMRMTGGFVAHRFPQWWEASQFYLAANTNKRGLTLDLGTGEGREMLLQLVVVSDVVVENFSPRVLDNFGLGFDELRAVNPQVILARMPAFGLDGPWRDRTGFAQTMEQISGLAWNTGHVDDQPRIQRGPCDPIAGMHAAFAMLGALRQRAQTGEAVHLEVAMVETALNVAGEQYVEWSANGLRLERMGNRSRHCAPQGLYLDSVGEWVALSVPDDDVWISLRAVLGSPAWMSDPAYDDASGRRQHHDAIDEHLRPAFAERTGDDWLERLLAAGVPAGQVRDPRLMSHHPQLVARSYYEAVNHPVVGPMSVPGLPFRFASVERWIASPAPTVGQHNTEILQGLLGLSDGELTRLAQQGIIGTEPRTA